MPGQDEAQLERFGRAVAAFAAENDSTTSNSIEAAITDMPVADTVQKDPNSAMSQSTLVANNNPAPAVVFVSLSFLSTFHLTNISAQNPVTSPKDYAGPTRPKKNGQNKTRVRTHDVCIGPSLRIRT